MASTQRSVAGPKCLLNHLNHRYQFQHTIVPQSHCKSQVNWIRNFLFEELLRRLDAVIHRRILSSSQRQISAANQLAETKTVHSAIGNCNKLEGQLIEIGRKFRNFRGPMLFITGGEVNAMRYIESVGCWKKELGLQARTDNFVLICRWINNIIYILNIYFSNTNFTQNPLPFSLCCLLLIWIAPFTIICLSDFPLSNWCPGKCENTAVTSSMRWLGVWPPERIARCSRQ